MWNLTGTPEQNLIVQNALNKIKFPFERLSISGSPEIGWKNLNDEKLNNGSIPGLSLGAPDPTRQEFLEGAPHSVEAEIEGREFIAGVFYSNGNIYIDPVCQQYPDVAGAVVACEGAHATS